MVAGGYAEAVDGADEAGLARVRELLQQGDVQQAAELGQVYRLVPVTD